jgi:transposase InsO family protein
MVRMLRADTSWTNHGVNEDVDEGDDDVADADAAEFAALPAHEEVVQRFLKAARDFPPDFLTPTQRDLLVRVVRRHPRAFGRKLRPEPMRVDPITVELKPGAEPTRAGYATYDPKRRAALHKGMQEMLDAGVIRPAPGNLWTSPVFLVPKKAEGEEKAWRVVTNCQPLDQRTRSIGNEPLDLKAVVARVGGDRFRGAFDILKAFWQLPVAQESQQYFGIQSDTGVFTYARLPMGWKNSPSWLKLRLDEVFADLQGLERWVDDVLVHAADFPAYARALDAFLGRCVERNVILKPTTQLIAPEVDYVGVHFTQTGYRRAPSTFGAVRTRPVRTAADLSAVLGFFQFFSGTVSNVELLAAPLRVVLRRAQQAVGSLKKQALKGVPLDAEVGFTPAHAQLLERIWQRVEGAIDVAYPNATDPVMIITDASDTACAGVVMQCTPEEWAKPPASRRGRILYAYSHRFAGPEERWSVTEKELHPLHHIVTRSEHVLLGRAVHAYTDHLNLIYLLHNPNILQRVQAERRVGRRITEMSHVHLTVQHIPGIQNVFLDYLSRGGEAELEALGVRRVRRGAGSSSDAAHGLHDLYAFPSKDLLASYSEQEGAAAAAVAAGFTLDPDGLYRDAAGGIFVPEGLRGAFLVAAHAGAGGHRGIAGTLYHLGRCTWPEARADVERVVRNCVHCARADVGTVPRPLGTVFHGTKVGQVLHLDYIDFPADRAGRTKVLVGKDDVSQCVFAYPCAAADSATTVARLRELITTHSLLPEWVVSDNGSHFQGALTEALAALGVQHKTHLPYTPQANGTIERANKELVRTVTALLSERRLPTADWPEVLDIAVMAVNNSPSAQMGGVTPHEVFTGRSGINVTQVIAMGNAGVLRGNPLGTADVRRLVDAMRAHFSDLERAALAAKEHVRGQRRRAQAARAGITDVDFGVGDYVLVSAVDGRPRRTDKLEARWQGPALVTSEVSPLVYDVQFIGNGRTERVHAQRLRYFDGPDMVVGPLMQKSADLSLADRYTVDKIVGLGKGKHGGRTCLGFTVTWEGYDPSETTFEPVTRMYADVPDTVEAYLARTDHTPGVRKWLAQARAAIARARKRGARAAEAADAADSDSGSDSEPEATTVS